MRHSFIKLIVLLIILFNIKHNNIVKLYPQHVGVDPKLQVYVDEYKDLANIHGIHFTKNVTVGFKTIADGPIVGLTYYGYNWREIDIDKNFWDNSTNIDRNTLILHELTHAYCGRDHDYRGIPYASGKNILSGHYAIDHRTYYRDKCPKSIMYPVIIEKTCMLRYFNDYVNEMFENCEKY